METPEKETGPKKLPVEIAVHENSDSETGELELKVSEANIEEINRLLQENGLAHTSFSTGEGGDAFHIKYGSTEAKDRLIHALEEIVNVEIQEQTKTEPE